MFYLRRRVLACDTISKGSQPCTRKRAGAIDILGSRVLLYASDNRAAGGMAGNESYSSRPEKSSTTVDKGSATIMRMNGYGVTEMAMTAEDPVVSTDSRRSEFELVKSLTRTIKDPTYVILILRYRCMLPNLTQSRDRVS